MGAERREGVDEAAVVSGECEESEWVLKFHPVYETLGSGAPRRSILGAKYAPRMSGITVDEETRLESGVSDTR